MSTKGSGSQLWKLWFAPTPSKTGQHADIKISWFLWNLLSGARLSTWPQPGTRTPTRVVARLLSLGVLAVVVAAVVDGARRSGIEWWTAHGLGQVLTDAAERQAAERPWLPPALWVAAAGSLAAAGWLAAGHLLDKPHYDRWVDPLHKAICQDVWGVSPDDMRPNRYLLVPRDFDEAPTGIRVRAPITLDSESADAKRIERKTIKKLPIGDVNTAWITEGPFCFLQITAKAKLPKTAFYATEPTVAAEVHMSKSGNSFLGFKAGNKPYRVDFTRDTPHGVFSAGTGGGKSVAVKAIAVQEMHNGAGCVILDVIKRKSHRWAKDPATRWRKAIPGVIYCRKIPEGHRALVALGRELARRQEASEEIPDDAELDEPRIVVICEELNATMGRLEQYWRKIKNDPDLAGEWLGETVSPAVQAYRDALLMGRAERVNVLAVAQQATARATGGGEARENYGLRALTRFSEQTRKMLIPTVGREYRSSKHPGRWVVAQGDNADDVQVVLIDDKDARALATSGVPSRLPFGHRADPVDNGRRGLHVVKDGDVEALPLRVMSADEGRGLVPHTLATLNQARYRHADQGFPRPVGRQGNSGPFLYPLDEVKRWSAERAAAEEVEA